VVVCNAALRPGVSIEVRPIGVLLMEDQMGRDEKIICVPIDRVDPFHKNTMSLSDLPLSLKAKIEYFFKHYKDLEYGSWSKVTGWGNLAQAQEIIKDSIQAYEKKFAKKSAVQKKK